MFSHQPWHPSAEISRSKGLFRHRGVLLADGRVARCAPGRGEHVSSVEAFAAGGDVRFDRELAPAEIAAAMLRLDEALRSPKVYDLISNNCETFVNRMMGREPSSQQVIGGAALIGLAVILALTTAK